MRERQAEAAKHRAEFNRKPRGEESRLHQLMHGKSLSRMQKAKIAESAVLLRLSLFDFHAFGSMFDGDKTDWLVEVPQTGKVVKVQVRWARKGENGLPSISLRCSNGRRDLRRYRKGEFDVIVAYDLYTDTAYVWTWDEVAQRRSGVTISADAGEKWEKLNAL